MFFRIQEVLDIQLKHISVFPDHIAVFLPHAKADQHRDGDTVVISKRDQSIVQWDTTSFLKNAGLALVRDTPPQKGTRYQKPTVFHIPAYMQFLTSICSIENHRIQVTFCIVFAPVEPRQPPLTGSQIE